MQADVLFKVKEFIKKYNMLQSCDCIIAGVSGGPDSMVMLDILNRLREVADFELRVVHINHGIRGDEAFRDENAVREVCKNIGVYFNAKHYDVPALSTEWKKGHEETGRIVRRKAFDEEKKLCIQNGKKVKIALAHNQNDVAETMLHNMARGSGIRGLCSLKPVNGEIIRPLLCLDRSEIMKYTQINNITYVTDSTNLEDEYTRNKIRRYVLPVLTQSINREAIAHMAMTSQMLSQAETYFEKIAIKEADSYKQTSSKYILNPNFFEKEEVIKSYVIREIIERLSNQVRDISSTHINQIIDLYGLQTGRRIDLPYSLRASRCYEGVAIEKNTQEDKSLSIKIDSNSEKLNLSGKTKWQWCEFYARIFDYSGEKILEKKYTKWFDCDRISCELAVRTRQSGDFMIVNPSGGHKKIARCMIDDKIARDERDNIPLIADGNEILWIIGGRMSEKYKITPDTKKVLEITYQGGNEL